MLINLNYKKFFACNLILIAVLLLAGPYKQLLFWAGLLYLLLNSLALGNWLFLKNSWTCKFIYGLLFLTTAAGLLGTLAFYLAYLNQTVFYFTLGLLSLALTLAVKRFPLIFDIDLRIFRKKIKFNPLPVLYLLFFIVIIYILFNSQTSQSIRSPWEILPPEIFYLYFFATLCLFFIIRSAKTNWPLFFTVLHCFLSFSVAWIVYRIGFDYDPFIHRTNLQLILANGTLLPKPFYYIGQYSLIIFIHRLLNVSLELLDKILVPLTAAVYLPSTIFYAFKDNFKAKGSLVLLLALSFLIFPFTDFISTTPQALANLFFLLTVLLSLYYITHPKVSLWPLGLLTLMTVSIHPLSGIPLLFYFIILALYQHWKSKFKLPVILHQSILWEMVILGALALPIAFIVNSLTLSQLKVSLQSNWWLNIIQFFSSLDFNFYYRKFVSFTDLIYDFGYNQIFLIITLAAVGIFFIHKHRQLKRYAVYLLGFLILIANFLLVKGMISFLSLVSYEQLTYADRIFKLAVYMLSPFILITFYLFYKKLAEQKSLMIFLSFILISLTISVSFYLSYPRVDKIVEDHGYSTSAVDIKAVNFIERIQKNQPYVVLASQPVSAAAIKELGFKYYYNGYYFYPVPTGGRLYQLYEDLAYGKQPTPDIIATVRYLTGINDVYFVLNGYWFDAAKKIAAEKETADQWYGLDAKNYIFRYTK
jgi:hypothetical protein